MKFKVKDNFEIYLSCELISSKGISRIREIIKGSITEYHDKHKIFGIGFDSWVLFAEPISIINPLAPPSLRLMMHPEHSINNENSPTKIFTHFEDHITLNHDNLKYAIKIAKTIIKVLAGKYDKCHPHI